MGTTKYTLQINQPGARSDDKEYLLELDSDTPFMTPSKGDVIYNRWFPNPELIEKGKMLRVTGVEHIIQNVEDVNGDHDKDRIYHYVFINTELIDENDHKARGLSEGE